MTDQSQQGHAPAYRDREQPKNVHQRLLAVQVAVVAARTTEGKFGPTRSAEQILAEAKPHCEAQGLLLITTDSIEVISERRYLVSTVQAINVDEPEQTITSKGYAWEGEVEVSSQGRPILDTAQVTGKTSSYATKYALQHLLAIGGEADADQDHATTTRATKGTKARPEPEPEPAADPEEVAALRERANKVGAGEKLVAFVRDRYGKGVTLTAGQLRTVRAWVEAQEKAKGAPGPQGAVQQPQGSPQGNGPVQGDDPETASIRGLATAEWNELEPAQQAECMADLRQRGWALGPGGLTKDQLGVLINEVIPAHSPAEV